MILEGQVVPPLQAGLGLLAGDGAGLQVRAQPVAAPVPHVLLHAVIVGLDGDAEAQLAAAIGRQAVVTGELDRRVLQIFIGPLAGRVGDVAGVEHVLVDR